MLLLRLPRHHVARYSIEQPAQDRLGRRQVPEDRRERAVCVACGHDGGVVVAGGWEHLCSCERGRG